VKNILIVFAAAVFISLSACEKTTEDGFKDLAVFAKSDEPQPLPDSTIIRQLGQEFAPERQAILDEIKRLDVTRYDQMRRDLQNLDTVTTPATFSRLAADYRTAYSTLIQTAWDNLNLNRKNLSDRAQAIMGNIPFSMGNHGEINGGRIPVQHSSPLIPLQGPDLRTLDIWDSKKIYKPFIWPFDHINFINQYTCNLSMVSFLASFWIAQGEAYCNLPLDKNYRYFRLDFIINSGLLKTEVGGLGFGGSVAGLTVKLEPPVGEAGYSVTRDMGSKFSANCIIPLPEGPITNNLLYYGTLSGKTADYIHSVRLSWKPYASAGFAGIGGSTAYVGIGDYEIRITYFN